ncbi:hypothetical protein [Cellulomonas aerilata]|uniref:Uncharacterized protein n=1 Tax=Cellulomonas aerilata TaxID=515326 RepID=A0A512DA64_9CELL|nr:hypothetical protein [Cellulomonas aerilata]GEO33345.1 hypothetical protein CAE01nite_10700 [Cellulomonas aerilata]
MATVRRAGVRTNHSKSVPLRARRRSRSTSWHRAPGSARAPRWAHDARIDRLGRADAVPVADRLTRTLGDRRAHRGTSVPDTDPDVDIDIDIDDRAD